MICNGRKSRVSKQNLDVPNGHSMKSDVFCTESSYRLRMNLI